MKVDTCTVPSPSRRCLANEVILMRRRTHMESLWGDLKCISFGLQQPLDNPQGARTISEGYRLLIELVDQLRCGRYSWSFLGADAAYCYARTLISNLEILTQQVPVFAKLRFANPHIDVAKKTVLFLSTLLVERSSRSAPNLIPQKVSVASTVRCQQSRQDGTPDPMEPH